MNSKQAEEASKCDPGGVVRVLEGLMVECPECKGSQEYVHFKVGEHRVASTCNHCEKGKISYSYQPQVGEWYYQNSRLHLITDSLIATERIKHEWNKTGEKATPILEWEVVEEILEKAGYVIEFIKSDDSKWRAHILSDFKHRDILDAPYCKHRLPAVYEAVLALGKEIKK